jgi:hypothetical protein
MRSGLISRRPKRCEWRLAIQKRTKIKRERSSKSPFKACCWQGAREARSGR